MAEITEIQILNEQGAVIGTYPILIASDQAKVLAEILPYLTPSYNTDGTIKNIQIASPKNINIEPAKGVKIKPGTELKKGEYSDGQVELLPDHTSDLREAVLKVWRSIDVAADGKTPLGGVEGVHTDLADEILVRLKAYMTELEINTYDKVNKSRKNAKIKFRNKDAHQKGVIEGSALDLRAYSTGAGTGGGIAVQIAGVDSSTHANKFKIETDQTADVDTPQSPSIHNGEGGKGIEIGTISPMMTSLYTRNYRFKADAPIYAVTRGPVAVIGDKTDYPTQTDDSKDIIPQSQIDNPVTWADIIAAGLQAKQGGGSSFPNDTFPSFDASNADKREFMFEPESPFVIDDSHLVATYTIRGTVGGAGLAVQDWETLTFGANAITNADGERFNDGDDCGSALVYSEDGGITWHASDYQNKYNEKGIINGSEYNAAGAQFAYANGKLIALVSRRDYTNSGFIAGMMERSIEHQVTVVTDVDWFDGIDRVILVSEDKGRTWTEHPCPELFMGHFSINYTNPAYYPATGNVVTSMTPISHPFTYEAKKRANIRFFAANGKFIAINFGCRLRYSIGELGYKKDESGKPLNGTIVLRQEKDSYWDQDNYLQNGSGAVEAGEWRFQPFQDANNIDINCAELGAIYESTDGIEWTQIGSISSSLFNLKPSQRINSIRHYPDGHITVALIETTYENVGMGRWVKDAQGNEYYEYGYYKDGTWVKADPQAVNNGVKKFFASDNNGMTWRSYSDESTMPALCDVLWSPSKQAYIGLSLACKATTAGIDEKIMSVGFSTDGYAWQSAVNPKRTSLFYLDSVFIAETQGLFLCNFNGTLYISQDGTGWYKNMLTGEGAELLTGTTNYINVGADMLSFSHNSQSGTIYRTVVPKTQVSKLTVLSRIIDEYLFSEAAGQTKK